MKWLITLPLEAVSIHIDSENSSLARIPLVISGLGFILMKITSTYQFKTVKNLSPNPFRRKAHCALDFKFTWEITKVIAEPYF
jgi:hypothetical protein